VDDDFVEGRGPVQQNFENVLLFKVNDHYIIQSERSLYIVFKVNDHYIIQSERSLYYSK